MRWFVLVAIVFLALRQSARPAAECTPVVVREPVVVTVPIAAGQPAGGIAAADNCGEPEEPDVADEPDEPDEPDDPGSELGEPIDLEQLLGRIADIERNRTGALEGRVTDAATAEALPGVTIVATIVAAPHDETQTAITDENGDYVIRGLAPGTYSVDVYYVDTVVGYRDINVVRDSTTSLSPRIYADDAVTFSGVTSIDNEYVIE